MICNELLTSLIKRFIFLTMNSIILIYYPNSSGDKHPSYPVNRLGDPSLCKTIPLLLYFLKHKVNLLLLTAEERMNPSSVDRSRASSHRTCEIEKNKDLEFTIERKPK